MIGKDDIMGTVNSDLSFVPLSDGAHEKQVELAEHILWKKWVRQKAPDTFGWCEMASDGGFPEVPDLYDTGTFGRWFKALLLITFILYNVVSVIDLDVAFINTPELAAQELSTSLEDIQRFYLSTAIARNIAATLGYNIEYIQSVGLLGLLELLGMLFFISRLVVDVLALMSSENGTFDKWFKCQKIFWETLPTLSVYSGMRLLYCIVPSIIATDIFDLAERINEARGDSRSLRGAVFAVFEWIFCTSLKFIIGFDIFLMKLRIVTAAASNPSLTIWGFLPTLQFFIQVIGVVQLGPYTRKRLFVFIFGGEDGTMQEEEIAAMNTWNALLAMRIFESHSFVRFLVVMLSFSDMDFQSLCLNEDDEKKQELQTGCVSMTYSMWQSEAQEETSTCFSCFKGLTRVATQMENDRDIRRMSCYHSRKSVNMRRSSIAVADMSDYAEEIHPLEVVSDTDEIANDAAFEKDLRDSHDKHNRHRTSIDEHIRDLEIKDGDFDWKKTWTETQVARAKLDEVHKTMSQSIEHEHEHHISLDCIGFMAKVGHVAEQHGNVDNDNQGDQSQISDIRKASSQYAKDGKTNIVYEYSSVNGSPEKHEKASREEKTSIRELSENVAARQRFVEDISATHGSCCFGLNTLQTTRCKRYGDGYCNP